MADLRRLLEELAERGTPIGPEELYKRARRDARAASDADAGRRRRSGRTMALLAACLAPLLVLGGLVLTRSGDRRQPRNEQQVEAGAVPREGRPKLGGSIVYGLEAESPTGWCLPTAQLSASGIEVASALYDTLTAPNDGGDFVPYLAQSLEPGADYTTWTIVLRGGIRFHNGEPLTADAVKQNLDAYRSGPLFGAVLADVTDVRVTGPLAVEVRTRVPWVAFPAALWSNGRMGIVAPEQLANQETCPRDAIGTGPFKLVSWTPNDKLVVAKNDDYWQKDEYGNRLPYLDRIEFRPLPLVAQRVNGLERGELDLVHVTEGKQIAQLREDDQAGSIKLLESSRGADVAHVMLQAGRAPFNNINARLAVAYATNAAELNRMHEAGVEKLAKQPFAPETLGYQPDPGWPAFDLDRARAYLAKYKQETGQDLRFELAITSDPATQSLAAAYTSQWARAGIVASMRAATAQDQFINLVIGGNYQATLWRNFSGGDPDTLYTWWHSAAWNPQTQAFDRTNLTNFGRVSDPAIDDALDKGRSETDPAAREEYYKTIGNEFAKNAYNIWTWYVTWGFASKPDVHGVVGPRLPDGDARGLPIAGVQPVVGQWRG